MSRHTPGPWEAQGEARLVGTNEEHHLWCGNIWPLGPSYRGEICTVQSADHISGISRQEAEANARLIAAAPDLLAALKGILVITDRDHVVWDAARAAIAKAEGIE
jgi:hypothetical protein